MRSFIHVSHLMVGCYVLMSYPCVTYMLFTIWFFSSHLSFSYLPCAMNSIYRVHSSTVVHSNMHSYKEFKNLYALFEGEFILYVVVLRLTCLQVYFFQSHGVYLYLSPKVCFYANLFKQLMFNLLHVFN